MDLQEAATTALDLTHALHEALVCADLGLCEALLVRRAEAMVVFADRHRASHDQEPAAVRDLILDLKEQDRLLQEKAAELFALAAKSFHSQVGAQPASAYGSLSCLDQRA